MTHYGVLVARFERAYRENLLLENRRLRCDLQLKAYDVEVCPCITDLVQEFAAWSEG